MLVIAVWLNKPCPDWRRRKMAMMSITGPFTMEVNKPASTITAHTLKVNVLRSMVSIFLPVNGNNRALAKVPIK